jgi:hypothetical protein
MVTERRHSRHPKELKLRLVWVSMLPKDERDVRPRQHMRECTVRKPALIHQ